MHISDWSSDVCSSVLVDRKRLAGNPAGLVAREERHRSGDIPGIAIDRQHAARGALGTQARGRLLAVAHPIDHRRPDLAWPHRVAADAIRAVLEGEDRKSTRLNSSH